jgi:hypothetical protein
MSEKIEPALTEHEWRQALRHPPGVTFGFGSDEGSMSRHRLAAMCLYNTPEGFTQEDVALLVRRAAHEEESASYHGAQVRSGLRNLADRIAALLPPAP